MTLATGHYPSRHGVTGNDPPQGVDREAMLAFIDKAVTVQQRLHRERGYVTLQTGKWWEGSWARGQFTWGMTLNPPSGGRHGDAGLQIGRAGLAPIRAFLDTVGERPSYLWYAPMLPHQPHNPPQEILDRYLKVAPSPSVARYWAMVEWFDRTCGEVLALLESSGERDNTLVFNTTDNGWLQDPAGPSFLPRSKNSPSEGGVRTPILVRWPAKLKPLRDDRTLVSNLDFVPAVLSAAGLTAPADLPGLDLLDSGKSAQARNSVHGEAYLHDMVDLKKPVAGLRHAYVIEGRWKLILGTERAGGGTELFDLLADPHETKEVSAANPPVTARLRKLVQERHPEIR